MPAKFEVITLPGRAARDGRSGLPLRRRPEGSKKSRRYVISVDKPHADGPRPGFETFVERFEAKFLGGHNVIHKPLMEATVPTQVIEVPRKTTANSITAEQLEEAHEAILKLTGRQAIVVATALDSENAARGRARSLAERYAEDYAFLNAKNEPVAEGTEGAKVNPHRYLTAHAIPDPQAEGKFIGAASVRAKQEPTAKPTPAAKTPAT